eukprot:258763-Chlamydomonas_euryale.AAC.8
MVYALSSAEHQCLAHFASVGAQGCSRTRLELKGEVLHEQRLASQLHLILLNLIQNFGSPGLRPVSWGSALLGVSEGPAIVSRNEQRSFPRLAEQEQALQDGLDVNQQCGLLIQLAA